MMMLDYKKGRGVKYLGKTDYIISEPSTRESYFFKTALHAFYK